MMNSDSPPDNISYLFKRSPVTECTFSTLFGKGQGGVPVISPEAVEAGVKGIEEVGEHLPQIAEEAEAVAKTGKKEIIEIGSTIGSTAAGIVGSLSAIFSQQQPPQTETPSDSMIPKCESQKCELPTQITSVQEGGMISYEIFASILFIIVGIIIIIKEWKKDKIDKINIIASIVLISIGILLLLL